MNEPSDNQTNAAEKQTRASTKIASAQSDNVKAQSPNRARTLQALFSVLLIGAIGFGGGYLGAKQATEAESTSDSTQRVVLDKQSDLISNIAKEVGQSVVSINVTSQTEGQDLGFFGRTPGVEQRSAGTGIIIDTKGLIVTNRHVVPQGTTGITVTLDDGTELNNVEVVGRTSETDTLDIAFLRIKDAKGHKLVPAKIGKSSDMRVGQTVVAIGNALGQFQNSVTTGIISGYGRSVEASSGAGMATESLDDLFQTDAAINSGNSGGPLVNLNGEVVGINTAVADQAENIGFAIPIDNISGLIESVATKGSLERPYLGVVYIPVTGAIEKQYKLGTNKGAFVPKSQDYGQDTVLDGGPADKAGLKEGDVITKINDTELSENTSLASVLGRYSPGDRVTLTVKRDGKDQTLSLTLGTRPNTNG